MDEITEASVVPTDQGPRLRIAFGRRAIEIPVSDQVALVLSAGAWMMREFAARAYEEEWGGSNPTSRRIRSLPIAVPRTATAKPTEPPE